jgi:hypothetical protein
MRRNENRTVKRELLAALVTGNKEKVLQVQNRLRLLDEWPIFIQYEVKEGLYHLDYKDMKLTADQFEQLKQDCPQTVYWEEVKTYA